MKISPIEVSLIDFMGNDLSVVNAARVSFANTSDFIDGKLSEKDSRLITYLAKHKHLSPFNHTFLSFRVKAPIFVARQLVKHEYMPWNEVSRRYVDSEPEFFSPNTWRGKAENVKQGSSQETIEEDFFGNFCDLTVFPHDFYNIALDLYMDALAQGVCAEQARMFLPQNVMTEWIWSGTLGAVAKMLKLRLDPHTQYESQIVAKLIEKEVAGIFPVSLKALLGNYE